MIYYNNYEISNGKDFFMISAPTRNNELASDRFIREKGEPRIREMREDGVELVIYLSEDELQEYLSRYKRKLVRSAQATPM